MSIIGAKLPELEFAKTSGFRSDPPSDAFQKWAHIPVAAKSEDPTVIDIMDVIGEDPWSGGGITAKRIADALRPVKGKDIVARINSPGGNVFDGFGIYNLLRRHDGRVTVEIAGLAASAASVIAMAGDEIVVAETSFLMVHNSWGLVVGNRHDFRDAADTVEKFDRAMINTYHARTGIDKDEIEALLDAETFMSGSEAVERGFADRQDDDVAIEGKAEHEEARSIMARRQIEAALASQGVSRNQRTDLINRALEDAAERDAGRTHAARDAGNRMSLQHYSELRDLFKT